MHQRVDVPKNDIHSGLQLKAYLLTALGLFRGNLPNKGVFFF